MFLKRKAVDPTEYQQLGQSFFYFSFYRPFRPNFLKIEKKIKDIFFNFIFVFSSDSCQYSTGVQLCFFRFVFSTAARLIKLPPVTAPGEILPF